MLTDVEETTENEREGALEKQLSHLLRLIDEYTDPEAPVARTSK
jgi:hypothetical protein